MSFTLSNTQKRYFKVGRTALFIIIVVTAFFAFSSYQSPTDVGEEILTLLDPIKLDENEYYVVNVAFEQDVLILNRYAGLIDFDGDGMKEIVMGGEGGYKQPIYIFKVMKDGTLNDVTTTYVKNSIPTMHMPIGEVADYNGDGYDDIFIADGGSGEGLVSGAGSGGFLGGEPSLILSDGNGMWEHSEMITDEIWDIKNDPRLDANEETGRTLHAKGLASGDIDNDGDIDIQVESGGGADVLDPFFLINQTVETGGLDFVLKNHLINPEFLEHEAVWGYPRYSSTWRFGANELHDLNGDGYSDWIKAQLRAAPPSQQTSNFHQFIMNDNGTFRQKDIVPMQRPDFEDGFSYSRAIALGDLTGDGLVDIVISQDRNNAFNPCCTGRYIQVHVNNGLKDGVPSFTDRTTELLGAQEATIPHLIDDIDNGNNAHDLEVTDFNGDGLNDIIMTSTLWYPTNEHSPLVYMNTGDSFIPVPPEVFTMGREDFGYNPYALHINDDGILDFVFSDITDGNTTIYTVISKKAYLFKQNTD